MSNESEAVAHAHAVGTAHYTASTLVEQLALKNQECQRLRASNKALRDALKVTASIFNRESSDGMDAAEFVDASRRIWDAINTARLALAQQD